MSIQYTAPRFEPTTPQNESSPITNRSGLPPYSQHFLTRLCWNFVCKTFFEQKRASASAATWRPNMKDKSPFQIIFHFLVERERERDKRKYEFKWEYIMLNLCPDNSRHRQYALVSKKSITFRLKLNVFFAHYLHTRLGWELETSPLSFLCLALDKSHSCTILCFIVSICVHNLLYCNRIHLF